MRKTIIAVAAVAVGLSGALAVGAAAAQEGPPPHGHLMLTGLEFDEEGEPVGYKKCRLLAAGHPVPVNAHHANLHTGRAGEAQWEKAGNAVVPLAPLTPWSNCEEFAAIVFGGGE